MKFSEVTEIEEVKADNKKGANVTIGNDKNLKGSR